ncbi:hypothetical protein N7478_001195 [Penicillium angulare]|uniref:uncharacterized protein n=1 Tax=Penicillium angulare TaxID=116970 RepID=UPI00254100ED|nr:uncharacterized protein N7478_001195 [Penicillium angulare]KAJ5291944.1 hypothetical protein N7478_001195 [Penicillium angulare]
MAPIARAVDAMSTLVKRDSSSGRFSLYVFCIMIGCIVACLIGFSIYTMYHGIDTEESNDIPFEQRKYMRELRQRNLNGLAVTAKRPDMIVPIEELNY